MSELDEFFSDLFSIFRLGVVVIVLLRVLSSLANATCDLVDSPSVARVVHWAKRSWLSATTYQASKLASPASISNAFIQAVFFFSAAGIILVNSLELISAAIASTSNSAGFTSRSVLGLTLSLLLFTGSGWAARMAMCARTETRTLWRSNAHKPIARQMALYVPTLAFIGVAYAVTYLQNFASAA